MILCLYDFDLSVKESFIFLNSFFMTHPFIPELLIATGMPTGRETKELFGVVQVLFIQEKEGKAKLEIYRRLTRFCNFGKTE
jgi:hypothetical protein